MRVETFEQSNQIRTKNMSGCLKLMNLEQTMSFAQIIHNYSLSRNKYLDKKNDKQLLNMGMFDLLLYVLMDICHENEDI